jgi:hypothetical protein
MKTISKQQYEAVSADSFEFIWGFPVRGKGWRNDL